MSNPVKKAEGHIREWANRHHGWIERLARLGYIAKGVIYGAVGLIALLAAWGLDANEEGTRGAIERISITPVGRASLLVLGAGLFGYAFWRILMGIFNPEKRSLIKRAVYIVTGSAYVALAYAAWDASDGDKVQSNEDNWARTLMLLPLGQLLVGAVGLIFLVAGVVQIVNAYQTNFKSILKLYEMGEEQLRWAVILGRIGLVARSVVFFIVGGFIVNAAWNARAHEVGGLDEALALLARAPYGPFLLSAVALGTLAFAVFMLFESRFRRIARVPESG